jgi:hypothetical protein
MERKLAERRSLLDSTFGYLVAIDCQSSKSTLAKPASVVFEVEINRMLAWRELRGGRDAPLRLILFETDAALNSP